MAQSKAKASTYHHGDLRTAMIKAAVEELGERGVEGFTLRSCARRAGVSHAAPAHHFGDVTGLLTEVSIDAFKRLAASMQDAIALVEPGTVDQPVAAATGYVQFALNSPAEFQLIFRTERLDIANPRLRDAGQGAFGLAAQAIGAFRGSDAPMSDPVLTRQVIGLWSLAHGLASLLLSQQLGPLAAGQAITQALVPDLVREMLGIAAQNQPDDLGLIERFSAER